MQVVRAVFSLFDRRDRWKLVVLTVALVLRAGMEMLGVASIAPFLRVVADPSIIERSEWLSWVYEGLGASSVTEFLTFLGVGVVIVLAVCNAFSAAALWAMLRFSWGAHHRVSLRLLRGYLSQPYGFFVQRNSASFSKTILSEVYSLVKGVLTPMFNVVARSLVVVALVGLLVVLDPLLAALIVVILGGAYGSLFMMVKHRQRQLGRDRLAANQLRYKVTSEAFGGIKDVKVLQRESSFVEQYAPSSLRFSRAIASNATIEQMPRYLLETVAFGGIVLIVLYYLQMGEGIGQIFPVVALYAFAGYRLMPELQHLFAGITQIRFNGAALDEITRDLRLVSASATSSAHAPAGSPLRTGIEVDDVTFRYPEAHEDALRGATLSIRRNEVVGFVGASGSGKTTLVDILLGLYQPSSGEVRIDGVPLDSTTLPAWLRQVGYVPQHIFLCDDTIASNIAFGIRAEDVDLARVEQAARIAHLHDFVQTLPDGYATVVGERGVRLSGGQRQRIGIARALYHDPNVLVLDEATSALDGLTEDAVMEAIQALSGQKTIILIAHRLSTVAQCDRIYLLHHGRVRDSGTYDELASRSAQFRAMAKMEPAVAHPIPEAPAPTLVS